jgi:hypothetical protein
LKPVKEQNRSVEFIYHGRKIVGVRFGPTITIYKNGTQTIDYSKAGDRYF